MKLEKPVYLIEYQGVYNAYESESQLLAAKVHFGDDVKCYKVEEVKNVSIRHEIYEH